METMGDVLFMREDLKGHNVSHMQQKAKVNLGATCPQYSSSLICYSKRDGEPVIRESRLEEIQ